MILRPFLPGSDALHDGSVRIDAVIARLLDMADDDVTATLRDVEERFAGRHTGPALDGAAASNFARAADRIPGEGSLSAARRRLIGLYFTHEYSVEAAALGNPSIVRSPDQSGLSNGELRFILSLRSVGEGHLSSIAFRSGVIGPDGTITVEAADSRLSTGATDSPMYDRSFFLGRLRDASLLTAYSQRVLGELDPFFDGGALDRVMRDAAVGVDENETRTVSRFLAWLAAANYVVRFDPDVPVSGRIIFPRGPTETQGMEDARFVRFVDDDGTETYYGTYTAFDGRRILPQLLETSDFTTFRVATMLGSGAHNKGIAIFPRRVNGRYYALGRHDNVNNFVMASHSVREWRDSELIQEPSRPWESMQLGNCGSPIETDAGWLVITHGVGPMRQYSIGALLLDLDDPREVIGHLREPLLTPTPTERDGYVPNVVYSCGSLVHDGRLILPYGFADLGASFASVDLADLLSSMS